MQRDTVSITIAVTALALLLQFCHASHTHLPCEGLVHHFFDGAKCTHCNRGPCGVGLFRETCTESSTSDAQCVPCKPPPSENAVHTTGGLPFMQDNCMWACNPGFYKFHTDSEMLECLACSTEACPEGMVRETCPLGSTQDASCVCPVDHFMSENDSGGCTPCQVTSCPEGEMLSRCIGTETSDVSMCSTERRMEMRTFPHPA